MEIKLFIRVESCVNLTGIEAMFTNSSAGAEKAVVKVITAITQKIANLDISACLKS